MALLRSTASRVLSVLVLACGVTAGVLPPAQAGDGVTAEVERILSTAVAGVPLEVVTTRASAEGPIITSRRTSSLASARDLIRAALAQTSTIGVDLAHPVRAAATNDPFRPQQWALTQLKAETVWRKSRGKGTVVAVIDSGVRRTHRDLAGRLLAGRDFVDPGTSSEDTNGHGTHVAGTIAAVADNRRGVAGLAPSARILPVRVLDRDGVGSTADVARGIVWAVNHGADVINLSLSTTQADTASREAVAYAQRSNVVVVAAAGNSGCPAFGSSRTTYPAAYPGVIGVGALDRSGAIASYSSCGSFVDVVAPGSDIVSTTIYSPPAELGCPARTSYCFLDGTSMAAPHVAASAAILVSRIGPGWRASDVAAAVTAKADDVGAAGYDRRTGFGRLNTQRMLYGR
ncbi:S8 family serine peptidase [Aeromicrobium stalagmiti]|uniref:S8 family serine peptidase n=1 Tax=Aeromicrobium stalagmiti TaxID=2738988 RepID=UPI001569A32E|nr:S8 family serine peptidase [Aeromicrobium stalagmiti]